MNANSNGTALQSGQPVVILTAGGTNPWMIINALHAGFADIRVIEEKPEAKSVLLARRIRRFGVVNAFGQMATMAISRFGKRFAEKRIRHIAESHGLSGAENPDIPVFHVDSLNGPACHQLLETLRPAVVLTISCRLLSRATLAAIPCPVINLHSAINPNYRGQMGCYWALVNGDRGNFGATVHLVDAGVDTGTILYQIRTAPEKGDTMLTYPALVTARSVDITRRAVADALAGTLKPGTTSGPSRLHFNVPVWTWLWHGLTKGIW